MITIIEEPKVKETQKLVYNPIIRHKVVEHIDVLRIDKDEEYTIIDFIYHASPKYINGGWCQIDRDTFIRPVSSEIRYTMVKAVNIPIAPIKHWFKSNKEFLCYTLFFPALPKSVKTIDIIEKELMGGTWFNFYGVSLERALSERLIVRN